MQNKLTQMVLFWFGAVMAAAFLCCGFLLLTTNFLAERVPSPNRTYLAIVMLFYAGFRGTRQYKMYQRIKRADGEQ